MPSRKKAKGKARKAQAAAAAGVPQQRCLCAHGFTPPAKNDALWACYDAFERELRRLDREDHRFKNNPAMGGMAAVMVAAVRKCPHLWNASVKEKMKACMLAKGVDALLDSGEKGVYTSITCMAAVLAMENWDGSRRFIEETACPTFTGIMDKNRDAFEGCRRSVVRFFAKRTQCSCLDSYYATIKQTLPKMGKCGNCGKVQDRSKRRFMVCGACKKAQYW